MYIIIGTRRDNTGLLSNHAYGPFTDSAEAEAQCLKLRNHTMNRLDSGYMYDFRTKQVIPPPQDTL